MNGDYQSIMNAVAQQNARNESIENPYTGQKGAFSSSSIMVDGELINLNELSEEELAELMGEESAGDEDEGKSGGSSGGGSSSHRDDEFLSYMAFMETESSRMDNYM